MKTLLALTLTVSVAVLTTGCGSTQPAAASGAAAKVAARELTITMTDFAFSPATVELTAGEPVKLTVKNNGVIEHNWQVKIGDELIRVDARGGQSASKTFTPRLAGTYPVICSVAGHEQAGMRGTVVVK